MAIAHYLGGLARQLRSMGVLGSDNEPASLLKSATVTLTDDQIKALPDSPVTIVPAPGENKFVLLMRAFAVVDVRSGTYALSEGCDFRLGYTDSDSVATVGPPDFSGLFTDDSDITFFGLSPYETDTSYFHEDFISTKPLSDFLGKALDFRTKDGATITGGDPANTLKVTVFYAVVNL